MLRGPISGTYDPALGEVVEKLVALVDAGSFARGVALELRVGADVAMSCGIGTDGLHRPINAETVFAVYCCTKPIMALAIASLVSQQEISWDDHLGDILDLRPSHGVHGCTIEQVVSHTAGLHQLRAEDLLRHAPCDREQLIADYALPKGWSPQSDLAYANFLGWYWLTAVIAAVSGEDPVSYIRSSIIDPLGLGGDVFLGFDEANAGLMADRCGINVDLTGETPVPLMLEKAPAFMSDPDVIAAGGYASMAGLCRFYQALLQVKCGTAAIGGWLSPSLLDRMTSPHISGRYDLVMGRSGTWGLGFMTNLSTHMFGRCISANSFGHSGNAGSSFALCDVQYDLCFSVIYTAKVDSQVSVGARRAALVQSIYSALELH